MTAKTILVVDDKADVRLSLRFLLSNHKYEVFESSSLQEARTLLKTENIDLILLLLSIEIQKLDIQ